MVVLELMSKSDLLPPKLLEPFRRYDSRSIHRGQGPRRGYRGSSPTSRGEGPPSTCFDGPVNYDDWWYNLRPSNTEPLLRLNVEARTEDECQHHVDEVLALVAELAR